MPRRRESRALALATVVAVFGLLQFGNGAHALTPVEDEGAAGVPADSGAPVEPVAPADPVDSTEAVIEAAPEAPSTAPERDVEATATEASEPAVSFSPQGPPEPPPATFDVMRNDDVVELVRAEFGDALIVSAIEANATDFDVSPRVLVALKRAGVSEQVIEAMLASERASRATAAAAARAQAERPVVVLPAEPPPAPTSAPGVSPEAFARLSQAVEQLAAQASAPPPPPPKPEVDDGPLRAPRAWLADEGGRKVFPPTPAQVARTELKRGTATAIKTLQGLAGQALSFANPVLGSGLSGLFRSNDDPALTAVWALPGTSSSRVLAKGAVFEMDFANIPGIDPAEHRPAIVQLVPTRDNYRLVGAAKTTAGNPGIPDGPIIEESVEAMLEPLARGRYRVTLPASIGPGEYALVLRPIVHNERRRRRNKDDNSLGELLGGAANEALYLTWDFSVR